MKKRVLHSPVNTTASSPRRGGASRQPPPGIYQGTHQAILKAQGRESSKEDCPVCRAEKSQVGDQNFIPREGSLSSDQSLSPASISTPPSLVKIANPDDENKQAKQEPSWKVEELKKMLKDCDGGLDIYEKAKKANGGEDPTIQPGSGGMVDLNTGIITLDQSRDKCFAVQQLIQELSNLSQKGRMLNVFRSAAAGDLSREDFIRGIELAEYDAGVKNVLNAFDQCGETWGCKTTPKEWARKAKDFDDYYNNFLAPSHKEHYGKHWDKHYKTAYEKKHSK